MNTKPQIRMILWHRDSDVFEDGQWLLDGPPPCDPLVLFQRMAVPHDGTRDFYDTKGGCLYRQRGADRELIRDFTDMAFETIRAPDDWREGTGEDAPWHTLGGDGA